MSQQESAPGGEAVLPDFPIRYVTFVEPSGALDGAYIQVPPADHLGRMLVVDDDAVYNNWAAYRANEARDGIELKDPEEGIELGTKKASLFEGVDAHIAKIYARWLRFDVEYVEREAAARSFVAAGYEGDPGEWVSAYATNAGKSNAEAADIIISQADTLRAALRTLGALRMAKYRITTALDADQAQAEYDEIIAQADVIAAGLQ